MKKAKDILELLNALPQSPGDEVCICPFCSDGLGQPTTEHKPLGTPCNEVMCPQCGRPMTCRYEGQIPGR